MAVHTVFQLLFPLLLWFSQPMAIKQTIILLLNQASSFLHLLTLAPLLLKSFYSN